MSNFMIQARPVFAAVGGFTYVTRVHPSCPLKFVTTVRTYSLTAPHAHPTAATAAKLINLFISFPNCVSRQHERHTRQDENVRSLHKRLPN